MCEGMQSSQDRASDPCLWSIKREAVHQCSRLSQRVLKPSKSSKTRTVGPLWCAQNSHWVFPTRSVGKESACSGGNTGDTHLVPGLGRSLGEGNGSPLQYSCLRNPMDRGAYFAIVQRITYD